MSSGDEGPKGPGWIIRITGHHYHNSGENPSAEFVRTTLMRNLANGSVALPAGGGSEGVEAVALKDLGISYPILVNPQRVYQEEIVNPDPVVAGQGAGAAAQPIHRNGEEATQDTIKLQRFDFVVHLCWKPTLASQRHAAGKKERKPGE